MSQVIEVDQLLQDSRELADRAKAAARRMAIVPGGRRTPG